MLYSCEDFVEKFINRLTEKLDIQCGLMKSGSY